MKVIDLFAGAGGFSVGAHRLTDNVIGVELDDDACATHRAAGMTIIQADVTTLDPYDNIFQPAEGERLHLHASPPCTTFSAAGTGKGRAHLDRLGVIIRDLIVDGEYDPELAEGIDPISLLVTEPARWIADLQPDSISFEQVRAVMPIWEVYADYLEVIHGYSAWTAHLSAEQYGLPQTRLRAWLGASKNGNVEPPEPTHSKYHTRNPTKLDDGVAPWVSMADALGWEPHTQAGFLRRADNDDVATIDGVDYRARDIVDSSERPALAVTEKIRSFTHWVQGSRARATTRHVVEPAGTIEFGHDAARMRFTDDPDDWGYEGANRDEVAFTHYAPAGVGQKNHPANPRPLGEAPAPTGNHYFYNTDDFEDGEQIVKHKDQDIADADWTQRRPATTVMGDPRIWPPGHKVNQADRDRDPNADEKYGDRAGKRARKITVSEAAILQGFPPDYPFQGSKTSQFRQVGNAVPPPIAEVVLRSLTETREDEPPTNR